MLRDEEIRQRLLLGEESQWEFKQFEFRGNEVNNLNKSDLADDLGAFDNADGGTLLCSVSDDGTIQDMSREQIVYLDDLLAEICTDLLNPPLRIEIHHRKLDDKAFLVVSIPRGEIPHVCNGRAFVRVVSSKRQLSNEEILRFTQNRTQHRFLPFDRQIVPNTGFRTLKEDLWETLLSTPATENPQQGLLNIRLLATDEAGRARAAGAGILLCTASPHDWFPHATILATHYRGLDRASGQIDAQKITGPLHLQIADAIRFVVKNMRVSARKTPAREDLLEYSKEAIFEAIVNAVAHRDYSMSSRRIRISMFRDRLEIDTPGQLPNGLTIEGMVTSHATRNEVIASVFSRISVANLEGGENRNYLMERRGDGVSIIRAKTLETSGILPEYRVLDEASVVLSIPAAKLEINPVDETISVHSKGEPLDGVEVLALFPNKTWVKARTDVSGDALLELYTSNLPMTIYVAAPGYSAGLVRSWVPDKGGLVIELEPLKLGGATIFAEGQGQIPGLRGTLNPKRDTLDRTYMYADNIAIDNGKQQPVMYQVGRPVRLTDSLGQEMFITIQEIIGKSTLIEYRTIEETKISAT